MDKKILIIELKTENKFYTDMTLKDLKEKTKGFICYIPEFNTAIYDTSYDT